MGTTESENETLVRELTEELNAGYLEVIEEYLVDGYGEDVVVLYDVSGTHEGRASPEDLYRYRSVVYTVPPTGNEVFCSLFRRFEIEDGRITLWESMQTPLTMLAQLGLDWETFRADLPEYVTE